MFSVNDGNLHRKTRRMLFWKHFNFVFHHNDNLVKVFCTEQMEPWRLEVQQGAIISGDA